MRRVGDRSDLSVASRSAALVRNRRGFPPQPVHADGFHTNLRWTLEWPCHPLRKPGGRWGPCSWKEFWFSPPTIEIVEKCFPTLKTRYAEAKVTAVARICYQNPKQPVKFIPVPSPHRPSWQPHLPSARILDSLLKREEKARSWNSRAPFVISPPPRHPHTPPTPAHEQGQHFWGLPRGLRPPPGQVPFPQNVLTAVRFGLWKLQATCVDEALGQGEASAQGLRLFLPNGVFPSIALKRFPRQHRHHTAPWRSLHSARLPSENVEQITF